MKSTTTTRGLGWQHQQIRRRLLVNHTDGAPCWWCGKPMYREPTRNWDWDPDSTAPGNGALAADHTIARAAGGARADRLLHGLCNKQRGDGTRDHLRPAARPASITVTSCGTTNRPTTAAMIVDCRRLPNPHDVPALRPSDGRSTHVRNWVLDHPEAQQLIEQTIARVGRPTTPMAITVMCSAGRHRSVAIANELATRLAGQGHPVTVTHATLGATDHHTPSDAHSQPAPDAGGRVMPWPW